MNPSESEDLNLHVSLCEQRYAQLNEKLDRVDLRLTELERNYHTGQKTLLTTLLATTATIIAAVIGAISTLV